MADYRQDVEDVNNGRYDNVLIVLVVVVMLYILVQGWQKTKQETLSNNINTDANALLAQRLYNAFTPWGMGINVPDDTDTPAVYAVAQEIKNYSAVAQAYRTLYNRDLSTDLQSELNATELQKFWALIGSGTSTPKTTTGGTTSTSSGSGTVKMGAETVNKSLLNKICVATQSVNVRDYTRPLNVVDTASKGEKVGPYAGEATLVINGTTGNFVHIRTPIKVWLTDITLYHVDTWVHKGSLTFI